MVILSFLNYNVAHKTFKTVFNKTIVAARQIITPYLQFLVLLPGSRRKGQENYSQGLPQAFNSYYTPVKRHFE
jgi:hypothetical protein